MSARAFLLAAALACSALPARAQAGDSAFLAAARAGTRRYESQETAVADGYSRVGVEFPAMGEHWVNLHRLIEDTLVAARPPILIYVNVAGTPRLAGVAYVDLLHHGEQAPPAPTGWHEHNGLVDEESLPTHHMAAMATDASSSDMTRVAVLHAWIWTANPDGVYTTDNWALPFARFGLAPDASAPRALAHGLALAADDEGYYALMLRTALALTPAEEDAADSVVRARHEAALTLMRRHSSGAALGDGERTALTAEWTRLWQELERALPARTAELRRLRGQL